MDRRMRDETCCFTGHRNLPVSDRKRIAIKLEHILTDLICLGIRYFGAGGALGFDTIAALTVLKLRKNFPCIKLILVLPCQSQTRGWMENDVRTFHAIKLAADKVVYTSEEYTRDCMHKRNRHLVDHSGTCVCYLKQSKGGTAYTVNYAKTQGLKVINLAD